MCAPALSLELRDVKSLLLFFLIQLSYVFVKKEKLHKRFDLMKKKRNEDNEKKITQRLLAIQIN
jgi:hypothetical protein